MLYTPVIAAIGPVIALLMAGDAGTTGGAAPGNDVPAARRPVPLLPTFPALGARHANAEDIYPALREAGDGSGDLIHEAPGFSARIARDGGVSFKDRRVKILGLLDPLLPKRGPRNVPSLQATILGLARNRNVPQVDPDAQTDDSYLIIPNLSRYRPDPKEGCRTCKEAPLAALPLNVTGRFDLTDELLRFSGQDPYRYEKARFLAATRDLRIDKAAASHAADLERAVVELPGLLERIACDANLTRRERQDVIQKLRDDLDVGTPEGDVAGRRIEQFLTARFGSPVADDGCPVSPKPP